MIEGERTETNRERKRAINATRVKRQRGKIQRALDRVREP